MDWSSFAWFALPAAGLWLAAGAVVYRRGERGAGATTGGGANRANRTNRASRTESGAEGAKYSAKGGVKNGAKNVKGAKAATLLMSAGIALFAIYIVGFWLTLGRPPMRTMGETRLWYSLFLSSVGFAAWRRWRYPWLLSYSAVVATVFVLVNILKPEIHSRNLMPALQSAWFVPHVTSYILSYAMLGAATIGALIQLNRRAGIDRGIGAMVDNMVWAGFGLLVLGMLMGAVWAKSAWGHYWEWDPKETWALATALAYLAYIHLRLAGPRYERTALWLLPVAFAMLLVTWIGVNYLPAAQSSIHVY